MFLFVEYDLVKRFQMKDFNTTEILEFVIAKTVFERDKRELLMKNKVDGGNGIKKTPSSDTKCCMQSTDAEQYLNTLGYEDCLMNR